MNFGDLSWTGDIYFRGHSMQKYKMSFVTLNLYCTE
jgi:hypothetical protein